MKVVIFAGGLGSRITEESHLRPKPMIEIGGKPIIWHIMKIYASQGFNDFIICCGYKGHMIKEYFLNYFMYNSDLSIDISNNKVTVHNSNTDNFKVTLIDTGLSTKTAGRLKKVKEHLDTDEFFLTYGDGVANIDIKAQLEFHRSHDKLTTMTIVQPEGKFGSLKYASNGLVTDFKEKPQGDGHWINGGFFIVDKKALEYLPEDDLEAEEVMWEDSPLEKLANDRQIMAFKHQGFWKCMDAMRDKIVLDGLWQKGQAQWKMW